jgi:hypothetical protein
MARKRRKKKSQAEVAEKLYSPGAVHDPNIAALLAKGKQAKTEAEALEVFLQLEKVLLEEDSLLEDRDQADRLRLMRQGARARDSAEEAWVRDRATFAENVFAQSDGKKLVGAQAEKVKAEVAKMKQHAVRDAMAGQNDKKLALDWAIENGPTEDVMGTGNWVMVKVPGVEGPGKPELRPDVVSIMHRQWVIAPGLNKDVPSVFARRYEEILQSRQETGERKALLGLGGDDDPGLEVTQLEQEFSKVDNKYGVTRQKPGAN